MYLFARELKIALLPAQSLNNMFKPNQVLIKEAAFTVLILLIVSGQVTKGQ